MIKDELTEKLQTFYQERINKKGVSYKSVWGDDAEWKANERFKIIEAQDFIPNEELVDLGCGHGLLCKYIQNLDPSIKYTGIDVVPEFLDYIKKTYDVATLELNFFNKLNSLPSSDWYAIFGSINKKWMLGLTEYDPIDVAYTWIAHCFKKAKRGMYINCFSDRVDSPKPNNVHLDPAKIIASLGKDLKFYRIRHDLEFYEFSLMVKK